MSFVSITNTFVNGQTSDAAEVNQNFTDVLNGLSDGTKDMKVATVTTPTLLNVSATVNLPTTGTITIPAATDTLVGKATTDTLTNKTLTSPVITGGTITSPTIASATLTSATLTSPVISTISNTGTLTLPTSTDTLVGKATTDVLTNKTLSGNTATNLISGSGTLTLNTSGTITVPNGTDTLVGKATTDVLTNKTLTTPVITRPTIAGVTDASSAAAGDVGEAVRSQQTTTNSGANNTWTNLTSISLTAGDWNVDAVGYNTINTATGLTAFNVAVSVNSGTTTTDHVSGDNAGATAPATSNNDASVAITGFRISISSTTTVYLKTKCNFSGGQPQVTGRISARRSR